VEHNVSGPESVPAAEVSVSRPTRVPFWSRPLRVHLSIVIVGLLICICVPLMWLTYQQGRTSAVRAGEDLMRELGLRAIDRYSSIFTEGLLFVTASCNMWELPG
jgi:hypothetical protein